jgi:hypothetical protein
MSPVAPLRGRKVVCHDLGRELVGAARVSTPIIARRSGCGSARGTRSRTSDGLDACQGRFAQGPPEVVSRTSSKIPAGKGPSNTARRPIGVGFPPESLASREEPAGRAARRSPWRGGSRAGRGVARLLGVRGDRAAVGHHRRRRSSLDHRGSPAFTVSGRPPGDLASSTGRGLDGGWQIDAEPLAYPRHMTAAECLPRFIAPMLLTTTHSRGGRAHINGVGRRPRTQDALFCLAHSGSRPCSRSRGSTFFEQRAIRDSGAA